jgi:hypothetical protein
MDACDVHDLVELVRRVTSPGHPPLPQGTVGRVVRVDPESGSIKFIVLGLEDVCCPVVSMRYLRRVLSPRATPTFVDNTFFVGPRFSPRPPPLALSVGMLLSDRTFPPPDTDAGRRFECNMALINELRLGFRFIDHLDGFSSRHFLRQRGVLNDGAPIGLILGEFLWPWSDCSSHARRDFHNDLRTSLLSQWPDAMILLTGRVTDRGRFKQEDCGRKQSTTPIELHYAPQKQHWRLAPDVDRAVSGTEGSEAYIVYPQKSSAIMQDAVLRQDLDDFVAADSKRVSVLAFVQWLAARGFATLMLGAFSLESPLAIAQAWHRNYGSGI